MGERSALSGVVDRPLLPVGVDDRIQDRSAAPFRGTGPVAEGPGLGDRGSSCTSAASELVDVVRFLRPDDEELASVTVVEGMAAFESSDRRPRVLGDAVLPEDVMPAFCSSD